MAGFEGADLAHGVQSDLVAVISWVKLGQKTDIEALESMEVDPEWEPWRWSSTSLRRDTGIRGLFISKYWD